MKERRTHSTEGPNGREGSRERNSVGVKQQKSQQQLAFNGSGKVKPEAQPNEGPETLAAGSRTESQVSNERLMEELLERENLKQALLPNAYFRALGLYFLARV